MWSKKIPLIRLADTYIDERSLTAIKRVVQKGTFILGKEVTLFEQAFARFCGVPYAVSVGTGLDALYFALISCGVGAGDIVVVPAHTFAATAFAVTRTGATPLFVDINIKTGLLDVNDAEMRIRDWCKRRRSSRIKAIIPVHLYGQMVDMDAVMHLAKMYNLFVVEDACQAHGASWRKRRSGSWGTAGCFSFYPSKNLGAWGDGGILVCRNKAKAHFVSSLRSYGELKKGIHKYIGTNSRLDTIQAAILRVKLQQLKNTNNARQRIARKYQSVFASLNPTLMCLEELKYAECVYSLFVVRTEQRYALRTWLMKRRIQTAIHYPVPLHLQRAYHFLGYHRGDFPAAEQFCSTVLSLPMFPLLQEKEVERVVFEVINFFKH